MKKKEDVYVICFRISFFQTQENFKQINKKINHLINTLL